MKIFDWMQRRFHHKDQEVARDVKKNELVKNENDTNNDTVALLEHAALGNVLDGWTEGILTIGTLGFDPLKDLKKQQKEYYFPDNDTEEEEYWQGEYDQYCNEINVDEEEDGEIDPLMFKACKHGFDDQNEYLHCEQVELAKPNYDDEVGVKLKNWDCDEKKKRGERITLADLFSADADMENKVPGHATNVHVGSVKKKASAANNIAKDGISFTKKIIPGVKQDSRPIKKLHKLMTKMLKRKIHPDIEGKIQKDQPNELQVLNIDENGAAESVSLLQTQVAVC